MATKKPLVVSGGSLAEIPAGDTVAPSALGSGTPTGSNFLRGDGTWATPAGGGGGSLTVTEVTLDFGVVPVGSKSFDITDAAATTASKIVMVASANPAAGRQADELEMDGLTCAAVCLVDGTIKAFVVATPGPVTGQYKFNYTLG